MLPPWDSLPDLQAYQDRLNWILVWVGGLVGVMAAALAVFLGNFQIKISNRIGELESQRRQEEQATADEAAIARERDWAAQIVAAEREAQQLRKIVSNTQRSLSFTVSDDLRRLVSELPKSVISIRHPTSDKEAATFAHAFARAFENAGWEVDESEDSGPFIDPELRSVELVVPAESQRIEGEALAEAIRGATLRVQVTNQRADAPSVLVLRVGSTPDKRAPK